MKVTRAFLSAILSCLCPMWTMAQTGEDIRNHVIIVVDERISSSSWKPGDNGIRDKVELYLYQPIVVGKDTLYNGEPLYKKGDCLSIVTFSLGTSDASPDAFTGIASYDGFPFKFIPFSEDIKKTLHSEWSSIVKKRNLPGERHSIFSIAIPHAMKQCRREADAQLTNRTFVILITDRSYSDKSYFDDIRDFTDFQYGRTGGHAITKFDLLDVSQSVSRDYFIKWVNQNEKRYQFWTDHQIRYKNVDLYELEPLQEHLRMPAIIRFPEKIVAKRGRLGEFTATFKAGSVDTSRFNVLRLRADLKGSGLENQFIDYKADGPDIPFKDIEISFQLGKKKHDDTSLQLRMWANLRDGFYNSTVLTPSLGGDSYLGKDGLNVTIPIDYEKTVRAFLFGCIPIPLWDFLCLFCDNQVINATIVTVASFLLFIFLLWFYIRKKRYYKPDLNEIRITFWNKEKIMNTIDVTNPNRSQETLLGKYDLELPLKKHGIGFIRSPKYKLRIRIVNLCYKDLEIHNPKKLIQLYINKEKKGSDLTLEVTSKDVCIYSFINTGEISDCKEMENEKNANQVYTISYQIEYCIVSDKKPKWQIISDGKNAINYTYEFQFNRIHQEANIEFKDKQVEFIANGNQKVICGELDLSLKYLSTRAPYLNMEFSLSVIQNASDGTGYDRPEIVEIIPSDLTEIDSYFPSEGMNLHPEGTSATSLEFDRPDGKTYHLGRFYVNGNHHVILPVTFDLSKIKNPPEAEEHYTLVMKGQFWSGTDTSGKKDFRREFPVTILRNRRETALEVLVSVHSARAVPEKTVLIPRECQDNPPVKVHIALPFNAREILVNGGTSKDFNLIIRNTAEAESIPGAAVHVRNFQLNGPVYPDGIEPVLACGVDNPFSISGDYLVSLPKDLVKLKYGEQDRTIIHYTANSITGFKSKEPSCFDTEVRFPFSFEYIEDVEGKHQDPEDDDFKDVFQGEIVLPLTVAPSPDWMCIDFGTSAVVAEYGRSIRDRRGNLKNNLVNLRKKKEELLKMTFPEKSGEENKRKDKNESDTEFISSTIVFNLLQDNWDSFKTIRQKNEFKDSVIWFSPSTGMIDDPEGILPCLKSLMGYERLPKGILPPNEQEKWNQYPGLTEIKCIYDVVYRQLFSYYVPEGIEKLVLSVPNTFAPIHIEELRRIAINCIPSLRRSRIRFVSESDAVAYYYLSRRYEILEKAGIKESMWEDIDKNTLVYDMGAGTLDLTYFVKKETPAHTEIRIEGKMGVNKAGNYIDYLIAQILSKLLDGKSIGERIEKCLELDRVRRDESITPSDCNELKAYIRDSVKPALNEPSNPLAEWSRDTGKELVDITGNDILQHADFVSFLKEISEDVFKSFAELFGENGRIAVDLVIFSGRSTSLQVIRDSIMDGIAKYNTQSECKFVDIAAESFVKKGTKIDASKIKGLKSAVAAGALAYPVFLAPDEDEENRRYWIRNRNVYATYGIMTHTPSGWRWYPLIDYRTKPTGEYRTPYGMTISCYDSSQFSVNGEPGPLELPFEIIDSLYVLQSYSTHTLRDWKDDKKEMITILYFQSMENYYRKEDVALKINKRNEIELWIGDACKKMHAHDDFYNASFRKSMWPVIFSESKDFD